MPLPSSVKPWIEHGPGTVPSRPVAALAPRASVHNSHHMHALGDDSGGRTPAGADRRITALSVAWCINTFAYSIAYPFLPIYLHSTRGFPMSAVGLLYLIMGMARMLSQPVSGALVDRIGRRAVLIWAPAVRGIAFLVLAGFVYVDAGLWTLAALLFAVMFTGGFFQNASAAYVTDITSPAARPEAFSRVRVGSNIGWMAGPAVGACLARTPFALLFGITGILCMVTPFVAYASCPEPSRRGSAGSRAPGVAGALRGDREFLLLLLFAFPLFLVSSQIVSTLSIFAKDVIGMGGNEVGLIYTLNGLLVIVFQLRVTRAFARVDLARRVAAGSICYAVGYFAFAFCGTAGHAFVAVAVFTLGEMLVFPSLEAASSRMAPDGMVGRYVGTYGLVWGIGYAVGPFLGALLYERFAAEPVRLWGAIVVFALIAGGCFMRMARVPALRAADT
jgi:predicted MFS family arabinose efflux permease